MPNSGRLMELLTPGRPCWLKPASKPHRTTDYDLRLMLYRDVLVSVDARLPNPLLAEALEESRLAPFRACREFERERPLGDSRIDFRLRMPKGDVWLETKSVTLVEDGVARFPDAPTGRGTRHVRALTEAFRGGEGAAVVFVVQRSDAHAFAPNDAADPRFGEALRDAAYAGVQVYAWTCSVSEEAIMIDRQVPVILP